MAIVSRLRRVTPRVRLGKLPLSFAQEGLWFEQTLDPRNHAFNELLKLRLEGALRIDLLARALNQLIARHEMLRTEFREDADGPMQVVLPDLRIDVPLVDLTAMRAKDAEAAYFRAARRVRVEPFDLRHAPLLRVVVFRLAPADHLILVAVHHIVCDGWSNGIILRELEQLYESELKGAAPPLADPVLQYGDYAIWDRESLTDEAIKPLLEFWGERLSDPPALELPADRPARPLGTSPAQWVRITLDRELGDALVTLSQRERTTLSTTLLASFFIVLQRYSGQRDLVVGMPVATRNQRELEHVIGFFVNTLVLRAQVPEQATFRQFLSTLTRLAFEAYGNQRLPFERLVHYLRQERGLSGPLFQVVWAFHNTPRHMPRFSGLTLGKMATPMREDTQADLECQVSAQPGEISCRLVYRSERYDEATIVRLLNSWKALLRDIVSAPPDRHVSELSAVPAADRDTLLTWAGTVPTSAEAPTPVEASLAIDHFEAQVARTPDRIAIADGLEQVTYKVLDERANQLAHHLAELGVGGDVPVAICLERRLQLFVAVLATWKAGGAYVPLDPSYPPHRLALMLDQAKAPIVLTQGSLVDVLPATWANVVVLPVADDATRPTTAPARIGTPLNLAYVIFTSGSTGRPKAVGVTHQGYVNLMRTQAEILGSHDDRRVLQFSSFSFDAAAWEITVSLLCGGRLVLAGQRRLLGEELIEFCRREQIQTVLLPPSVIASLPRDPLPALSTLVTGAEACPAELAGMWSAGRRMFNAYGPTESSVIATMSDPIAGGEEAPAIGRPIPGSQVHLLDSSDMLAPLGAAGELAIGGIGLARGYLDRPADTAARFRPDPFSRIPGARLYHTGDMVRWRTDGTLAFLGRRDQQVKLRGFRIELGEIETVLTRHPAVRHAVVIARTEASAVGTQLLAYVVPVPGSTPTASALREHVRAQLPDYMVPAAVLLLDALPLTPNGKLDVRALPAPDAGGGEIASDARPQTPVEEILAGIWAEVLQRDAINRHDDFFALGGQSLLATQVVARARAACNVDLPLRTLFDAPTVAGLAIAIETLRRTATMPAAAPLQPVRRDRPLPLSFAQQRLWFLQQLAPASAAYHIAAALRLRGALDAAALHTSLDALVARHEALRTTFHAVGGVPVQVIGPPAPLPLPWIDLTALPAALREARAETLAAREARRPFALDRDPLLRVHAIRLADDDHLLLVTLHHIVCDGWSVSLLMREVSTLYRAAHTGTVAVLPPLPVQYADVAVWQRTWIQGDVLDAQIAYWRRQLGDAPGFDLPADVTERIAGSDRNGVATLRIGPALTQSLERLARQEAATVFITMLTALDIVLWAETGSTDLLVGTDIANRSDTLTEGLIGFFVNQLVLRTRIEDDAAAFRDLLAKNREVALDGFSHQDCPFEKVVEQVRPGGRRGDQPLFSVKMTLQNAPGAAFDLPDLRCDVVPPRTGEPKFDLLVTVVPRGDQLDLSLEYDAARFTPARVTRWGRQIATVLELAAADPQITLALLRQRIQHDAERLLRESADAHRKTVQAAFSTLRQARGAGVSPESRL